MCCTEPGKLKERFMSPRRRLLLALALLPGFAGCFSIKLPEKIVVNRGNGHAPPKSSPETTAPCDLAEQPAPTPGERPVLAVQDFQFGENMPADVGRALADLCRAAIHDSNCFVLVDRARIADILGERDFADAMKCDATVCLVEYGKLLGVGKMMHGRINRLGDLYILGVGITDVATGQQVSKSASLASLEDSTEAIPELVCRIIRDLSTEEK
jgi:hypothetical protein